MFTWFCPFIVIWRDDHQKDTLDKMTECTFVESFTIVIICNDISPDYIKFYKKILCFFSSPLLFFVILYWVLLWTWARALELEEKRKNILGKMLYNLQKSNEDFIQYCRSQSEPKNISIFKNRDDVNKNLTQL